MNRRLLEEPREENDWQSIRQILVDAVGEPCDEDVQAVRESVKRQIGAQRNGGQRWWIWNAAAAVACAAATLAVVDLRVGTRESTRPAAPPVLRSPVIASRELSQVALPPRPTHLRKTRLSAGIRSVAWDTQRHELKMTTADRDVVIVLPMNKESEEHEN
ncbi:MAG TPA: hypothetical protein VHZ55_16495 [Bryobacteraceae bacterium]|jgi:hypothetical protein|nr:hypothetical protein [Bryobacteraceae bacterium]